MLRLLRNKTIKFHEEKIINGIKFWCYHAGHVLGACQFMIEIAGVKVQFTGDFSREEDRHLMAAEDCSAHQTFPRKPKKSDDNPPSYSPINCFLQIRVFFDV